MFFIIIFTFIGTQFFELEGAFAVKNENHELLSMQLTEHSPIDYVFLTNLFLFVFNSLML